MGSPSSHVTSNFPQSNGRAEVAIKNAKRMIMDKAGPTGSLNNDDLLRALLRARNTPDPDCNISPAQVRGIWQGHSRCFHLHQPMHQQPIIPSHMARGMVPKGGRYANQDAALYRSPRHAYATTRTSIARRQSIPAQPTRFTP